MTPTAEANFPPPLRDAIPSDRTESSPFADILKAMLQATDMANPLGAPPASVQQATQRAVGLRSEPRARSSYEVEKGLRSADSLEQIKGMGKSLSARLLLISAVQQGLSAVKRLTSGQ